jgi:hypothetical protein
VSSSVRRSLTRAQKQVIAKRHLSGETAGDLDGYAGYSATEIRALLNTQGMRDIMAAERGHHDLAVSRALLKGAFAVEDAMDRNIARGKDQTQPQIAFQADKFLIELVMPKTERHLVEQRTYHVVDPDTVTQIGRELAEVNQLLKGSPDRPPLSTWTLHGTEGLASSEPTPSNGSDKSSDCKEQPRPSVSLGWTASEPDDEPDSDTAQ